MMFIGDNEINEMIASAGKISEALRKILIKQKKLHQMKRINKPVHIDSPENGE